MAMFHSYVSLPEGIDGFWVPFTDGIVDPRIFSDVSDSWHPERCATAMKRYL